MEMQGKKCVQIIWPSPQGEVVSLLPYLKETKIAIN